uniref:S-adenosylmethionine-dependent methyltransferase Rv2258c-like winged HTH domain-containing protein n=1 Tax=Ditylenchus dipsaci TaxID=166011 RepID=A0A915EVI2_9BILA
MMGAQFTLTQQYSEAKEEQVADNFKKKIATIISNGHLSLAISLVEPATALDVARIADLKARYCQEWLSCMACGDIIEVDQTGMQFWISEERLATLSSSDSDHFLAMSGCLPMYAGAFKEVAKAFKKDGPLGVNYSVYKTFTPK